jgi:hypothetical protein
MPDLSIDDKKFTRESRRFERYPVEVPARVELIRSRRKNRILFLKTCNLSASGAFFPEWRFIPVGTLMNVEYYLLFEDPDTAESNHYIVVTTVTGKVIRSDASGTAVCFEENYQQRTCRCLPSNIAE